MPDPTPGIAPEEARDALDSWARFQGLERTDQLLPAVSDRLHRGSELLGPETSFYEGGGDHGVVRPGRFSEGTYEGALPGGLTGLVGHHSYLKGRLRSSGGGTQNVYYVEPLTAVVVWLPEAARVARELTWTAEGGWNLAPDDPELDLPAEETAGDAKRAARATYMWKAQDIWNPAPEDLGLPALDGLPEGATVFARDGFLAVEAPAYLGEPGALCSAAAETASALRRAAGRLPELAPGDPLSAAEPLPELPALEWPHTPADTEETGSAYRDAGRDQARAGGLFGRLLGSAGVNVMRGIDTHVEFAREWGLEAFAREQASALGLRVTDRSELRRRFAIPLPGHVRRSLQGGLPGGLDGHLVLWEDITVPRGRRLLDVAIVRGRGSPKPRPGFEVGRSGLWLLVGRECGDRGHSRSGLEAAALEAARLAG